MKKSQAAQILGELARKQTKWTEEFGRGYSKEVVTALNMGSDALRKGEQMKIRVLVKLPKCPAHIEYVDKTLEGLQKLVRGHIETVTLKPGWCVICDEEGRIKGRAKNCKIHGVEFVGKIALAGVEGEELTDIEITDEFKRRYAFLWED